MGFDLEKLFVDVFAPQSGEVVTVMADVPKAGMEDNPNWAARREMARRWQQTICGLSDTCEISVNPLLLIDATGGHNRDLPACGQMDGEEVALDRVFGASTIVIALTEFSASAPLVNYGKNYPKLRAASMPKVEKRMEETGLSADYARIGVICDWLKPLFERAGGARVTFSTGHVCYFDLSDNNRVLRDDGKLHPGPTEVTDRLRNLPSGEVCTVPNEAPGSRTRGEIPAEMDGERVVFVVEENRIINVEGDGKEADRLREAFASEKALQNIAEVAIGCNDKAEVTGNVLEDEKAGFHFAYGRSDHLGGTVGVSAFSSPDKVLHQDIVYAKGNPVVCTRFELEFEDGSSETVIVDGELRIEQ